MAEAQTYLPADTRQRIQDILKERKIPQAKLAESIGISESAFSRYLQGKTEMPGDGYIIRIAKFLSVMNHNLDFLRSLMLGQARAFPKDKAAANAAAVDLQSMKFPPVSVDTAAIQNLFNQILRELRTNAESHLGESRLATKETFEKLRRELSKGQESVDLKSLTPEDIADAVTSVVPEGAFPEEKLQNLGSALTELLTAAADTDHNE